MAHRDSERRRTSVMGRLRRLLYAGLLSAGPQLPALAEEARPVPVLPERIYVALQILPPSGADDRLEHAELRFHDPRIAPLFSGLAARISARSWAFSDEWRRARGGVGLDIEVLESGNLHLNLVPARYGADHGVRWQLGGDGQTRRTHLWSLGGGVDLVRMMEVDQREPGAHRHQRLVLSPQLVLDLDQLADVPGSAQLTLQQTYWREAASRRAMPERVWQLTLGWRY